MQVAAECGQRHREFRRFGQRVGASQGDILRYPQSGPEQPLHDSERARVVVSDNRGEPAVAPQQFVGGPVSLGTAADLDRHQQRRVRLHAELRHRPPDARQPQSVAGMAQDCDFPVSRFQQMPGQQIEAFGDILDHEIVVGKARFPAAQADHRRAAAGNQAVQPVRRRQRLVQNHPFGFMQQIAQIRLIDA